ncbi:MAG: 2-amino-4-hydroxy-6-hydroxymethyldihydropteridine diphosphokinase [Phycisphaerae bacterium]
MTTEATAFLGLGANLGDRRHNLRAALDALRTHEDVRVDSDGAVASLFETTPVGGPAGQPRFLNSAVRIRTTRSPLELLTIMQAVEATLGRHRAKTDGRSAVAADDTPGAARGAPRTIDLDLLLYEDVQCTGETLALPHPRLHRRRFVLEPLAEIAPRLVHPRLQVTIETLRVRCEAEQRAVAIESPVEVVIRLHGPDWPWTTARR